MKDGNIRITVTGSGELSDGDAITNTAVGKIYTKNDARYFIYEISDENEGMTIKYLLKLFGNSLEMTKTLAGVKTKITYKPGKKTSSEYNSPFGKLLLTFDTTAFCVSENENSLNIMLKYNILMDEDIVSKNKLEIDTFPI